MTTTDDGKSKAQKELEELLVHLRAKSREQEELIKEIEQSLAKKNYGKS